MGGGWKCFVVSRLSYWSSVFLFCIFELLQQVKGPKVRKVVVRTYVRKHYVDTILYSYSTVDTYLRCYTR